MPTPRQRVVGAHDLTRVVVDAEDVERLGDQVEVAVEHLAAVPGEPLHGDLRIPEPGQRLDVPTVLEGIDELRLGHVGGIVRAGDDRGEVEHDSHRRLWGDLSDLAHGEGMADQQVVSGRHAGGDVLAPGGMLARHVTVMR